MADQKKDPYQYERMLRQRAQQAFSNQFPGFGTKPPEPDQPDSIAQIIMLAGVNIFR